MIVTQDDILGIDADAIVNPANEYLDTPGALDLKIHDAAGPELMQYLERYKKREYPTHRPLCCPVGHAVIAPGFNLKQKYCILTCGPIWENYADKKDCDAALAMTYRACLDLAVESGCKSIALPCISCGVFHFPIKRGAKIAIREMLHFEAEHPGFTCIAVCWGAYERTVYDEEFARQSRKVSGKRKEGNNE